MTPVGYHKSLGVQRRGRLWRRRDPSPASVSTALPTKPARCLRCRKWFPSYGPLNRVCLKCKSSEDWQHAGPDYREAHA